MGDNRLSVSWKCQEANDGGAPLDLGFLQQFTAGDLQLEREILTLFFLELPSMYGLLQNASSMQQWKTAMHTLKGTARSVGAWNLAELVCSLEALDGPLLDPIRKQQGLHRIQNDMDKIQKFLHVRFGL